MIINGCSRIEEMYVNLLSELAHLQAARQLTSFQSNLFMLESCIRNNPPVFTAAGFFKINQSLYSSICSELVTYIIVIIQFNNVNSGSKMHTQGTESSKVGV